MLPQHAIDVRPHVHVRGIEAGGDHRAERAERIEGLADHQAAIGHFPALDNPFADVIGAGIAKHVIERIFLADAASFAADHDRQLRLVVYHLRLQRTHDRLVRTDGCGGRHHEDLWDLGRPGPGLCDMPDVVHADCE